jgi:hypothetical protein
MIAFNELKKDRYSRRAIIPMLSKQHVGGSVKDTVCTEAIGFHIRGSQLYCIVHMRSSDQVYGLGIDIPTFTMLYNFMLALCQDEIDPYISPGLLTITAMSSHIYARHYDMVTEIIEDPVLDNIDDAFPMATAYEARALPQCRTLSSIERVANEPDSKFTQWLLEPGYDTTQYKAGD